VPCYAIMGLCYYGAMLLRLWVAGGPWAVPCDWTCGCTGSEAAAVPGACKTPALPPCEGAGCLAHRLAPRLEPKPRGLPRCTARRALKEAAALDAVLAATPPGGCGCAYVSFCVRVCVCVRVFMCLCMCVCVCVRFVQMQALQPQPQPQPYPKLEPNHNRRRNHPARQWAGHLQHCLPHHCTARGPGGYARCPSDGECRQEVAHGVLGCAGKNMCRESGILHRSWGKINWLLALLLPRTHKHTHNTHTHAQTHTHTHTRTHAQHTHMHARKHTHTRESVPLTCAHRLCVPAWLSWMGAWAKLPATCSRPWTSRQAADTRSPRASSNPWCVCLGVSG